MSNTAYLDMKIGEMAKQKIIKDHGSLTPEAIKNITDCSHEMATTIYGLWILDKNKDEAA